MFKLGLFVLALTAAGFSTGAAYAQSNDASAPPPASAERLKLAHEVFEAQGGVANVSAAVDQVLSAMTKNMPASSQQGMATIQPIMRQTVQEMLPRMIDAEAEVFAETFNEQQLNDILTFYQSPTGQVMRAKLPEMSGRLGVAISKFMPVMMANMLDKVCSQTTCTAAQLKELALLKQTIAAQPAP